MLSSTKSYTLDPNTGVFQAIKESIAAFMGFFRARASLIGIEAREAGAHLGITAAMGVGALVVVLFGYLLIVLAAVTGIAASIDSKFAFTWVTLGAAVLHLVGAFVLVKLAAKRIKQPIFTNSLEQIKKDQTWLTTTNNS